MMDQQTVKRLAYTGKGQDFPMWSTRFVAMRLLKGLHKSLLVTEEQPNEPGPLANGASNDEKKNHKVLMRRKLQTSSRNGTICGSIWH